MRCVFFLFSAHIRDTWHEEAGSYSFWFYELWAHINKTKAELKWSENKERQKERRETEIADSDFFIRIRKFLLRVFSSRCRHVDCRPLFFYSPVFLSDAFTFENVIPHEIWINIHVKNTPARCQNKPARMNGKGALNVLPCTFTLPLSRSAPSIVNTTKQRAPIMNVFSVSWRLLFYKFLFHFICFVIIFSFFFDFCQAFSFKRRPNFAFV